MAMKDLLDRFSNGGRLDSSELEQLRIFYETLEPRMRDLAASLHPTPAATEAHAAVMEKLRRITAMSPSATMPPPP
ncbi:hypothetical protein [Azospirillum doebereinerae]|uniref:Uncharacterized protein n=1 Tax=Azospirillum doebereinerae TaxID=92933 RepID=A0A3S0V3F8_9PROT|nr:hypothetical protein [Azospirillum doebereinerae]MCG5244028.1 hypothetical protein [Azospirillum doebereinerae]RUQ65099.1 hypothetical protein EJ913_25470 [Azospirillum doebereinerae]